MLQLIFYLVTEFEEHPITPQGALSASYVMVILVAICGILFWWQLNDIRQNIKQLVAQTTLNDKHIAVAQRDIENHEDRINDLENG